MDCRLQIASSGAPAGSPSVSVSTTVNGTTWRSIPSLPGWAASADGRVRDAAGRIRDPRTSNSAGYLQVGVAGKRRTIHALVAEAFHGPRPESPPPDGGRRWELDHRNGDKLDNRAANLEYVTSRENRKRAYDLGLAGKLSAADVHEIHQRLIASGGRNMSAIGREFGVTHTTIRAIKVDKFWKTVS